jgi:hypothetical protein
MSREIWTSKRISICQFHKMWEVSKNNTDTVTQVPRQRPLRENKYDRIVLGNDTVNVSVSIASLFFLFQHLHCRIIYA